MPLAISVLARTHLPVQKDGIPGAQRLCVLFRPAEGLPFRGGNKNCHMHIIAQTAVFGKKFQAVKK